MNLRFPRLIILFLVMTAGAMLFSGCATGPQVDPQITADLSARKVDPMVYSKIYHGRPLAYEDILELVRRRVPANIIIGYLESTEKVYNLPYWQLTNLKRAGAPPQLLNYLTETQGFYGNNSPKQSAATQKRQLDKYYNDKYYQDEAPFDYNPPIIDDWYDSAYEESLYSPFSFN